MFLILKSLNLKKHTMKKKIPLIAICFIAHFNAQITITKDVSFGNNGDYIFPSGETYQMHKFVGDKLLLNMDTPYTQISPYYNYARFLRLNSNGSLDVTFGTNGMFLDNPNSINSATIFDANLDYIISSSIYKYFSSGQQDVPFQLIATNGTYLSSPAYLYILPDAKIIARTENSFLRYLSNGTKDITFGVNGTQNTVPYDLNWQVGGNYYHSIFNGTSIFEFSSQYTTQSLRKMDATSGNIIASYGSGGYGITSLQPSYLQGSTIVEADNSNINLINDLQGIAKVSKTNSNGFLDTLFGVNGEFSLPEMVGSDYINYNICQRIYADQNSHIFSLVSDDSTQGQVGLMAFSYSGNSLKINNQTFYNPESFTFNNAPFELYNLEIKGNYIYLFSPQKVSRYSISQNVLSTNSTIQNSGDVFIENPFSNQLKIASKQGIKNVEFIDSSGRIILRESFKEEIDTSVLSKGNYLFKIYFKNGKTISKKVIKK